MIEGARQAELLRERDEARAEVECLRCGLELIAAAARNRSESTESRCEAIADSADFLIRSSE